MNDETANRPLMRYEDASFIRPATEEECEKSDNAHDGGVGAFTAIVNGEEVTCYVEPAEQQD